MKLVDNRQPHTVPFGSLKPGDVFYHEEAVGFMMKTMETGCDECSGISNAVSLACGATFGFEDDEQVEPVEARVDIRTMRRGETLAFLAARARLCPAEILLYHTGHQFVKRKVAQKIKSLISRICATLPLAICVQVCYN